MIQNITHFLMICMVKVQIRKIIRMGKLKIQTNQSLIHSTTHFLTESRRKTKFKMTSLMRRKNIE